VLFAFTYSHLGQCKCGARSSCPQRSLLHSFMFLAFMVVWCEISDFLKILETKTVKQRAAKPQKISIQFLRHPSPPKRAGGRRNLSTIELHCDSAHKPARVSYF